MQQYIAFMTALTRTISQNRHITAADADVQTVKSCQMRYISLGLHSNLILGQED